MEYEYLLRQEIVKRYKVSDFMIGYRIKRGLYRTDETKRYICVEDVVNLINNPPKRGKLPKVHLKYAINKANENSNCTYLSRKEIYEKYKIVTSDITTRIKNGLYRTDETGRYICVEDIINLINNPPERQCKIHNVSKNPNCEFLIRSEIVKKYKITASTIIYRIKIGLYTTDKTGRYVCVDDVINLINNPKINKKKK